MTNRWHDKAEALDEAWRRRYGTDLSRDGVALALGPAQLETACGDAWPGPDGLVGTNDDERNWGACTLRSLSAEERAVLDGKGIKPTIGKGHVERAAAAMAALAEAGMKPPSGQIGDTGIEASGATIHCDSRTVKDPNTGKPITIPHFVWFANFASHVDGAEYYLHLLGAGARKVIAKPGTAYELAAAMYARGYFGGFKPHAKYTGADGKEHDGNAENIGAYAGIVQQKLVAIKPGLADWRADAPAPEPKINLMTGAGVDAALNKLGFARPPLTKTSGARKRFAAIGAYQYGAKDASGRPLDVDGNVGPLTRGALERDLEGAK